MGVLASAGVVTGVVGASPREAQSSATWREDQAVVASVAGWLAGGWFAGWFAGGVRRAARRARLGGGVAGAGSGSTPAIDCATHDGLPPAARCPNPVPDPTAGIGPAPAAESPAEYEPTPGIGPVPAPGASSSGAV
ncbi:hypothetical protein GCM10009804_66480 [Kribbella hippodromi]|uniref:Uncharacterized protein n=1 Tax=Kribbella hippodromi TaxID=434347 RepID=A0ABN2E9C5_9ACTN